MMRPVSTIDSRPPWNDRFYVADDTRIHTVSPVSTKTRIRTSRLFPPRTQAIPSTLAHSNSPHRLQTQPIRLPSSFNTPHISRTPSHSVSSFPRTKIHSNSETTVSLGRIWEEYRKPLRPLEKSITVKLDQKAWEIKQLSRSTKQSQSTLNSMTISDSDETDADDADEVLLNSTTLGTSISAPLNIEHPRDIFELRSIPPKTSSHASRKDKHSPVTESILYIRFIRKGHLTEEDLDPSLSAGEKKWEEGERARILRTYNLRTHPEHRTIPGGREGKEEEGESIDECPPPFLLPLPIHPPHRLRFECTASFTRHTSKPHSFHPTQSERDCLYSSTAPVSAVFEVVSETCILAHPPPGVSPMWVSLNGFWVPQPMEAISLSRTLRPQTGADEKGDATAHSRLGDIIGQYTQHTLPTHITRLMQTDSNERQREIDDEREAEQEEEEVVEVEVEVEEEEEADEEEKEEEAKETKIHRGRTSTALPTQSPHSDPISNPPPVVSPLYPQAYSIYLQPMQYPQSNSIATPSLSPHLPAFIAYPVYISPIQTDLREKDIPVERMGNVLNQQARSTTVLQPHTEAAQSAPPLADKSTLYAITFERREAIHTRKNRTEERATKGAVDRMKRRGLEKQRRNPSTLSTADPKEIQGRGRTQDIFVKKAAEEGWNEGKYPKRH